MNATQFVPAFDIWPLPPRARAAIQPGQWVYAGQDGPKRRGVYLGQTKAGVDVVAWSGNFPRKGARAYIATLRTFAKGGR